MSVGKLKKIFVLPVLLLFLCHCTQRISNHSEAVQDRKKVPTMHTEDVVSLISDSGIVRYRIITKTWDIFDKADTPYWDFPDGIYLEKFNESFNIEAHLKADKARYNQKSEQWKLDGNVTAMNEAKEHFFTQQLLWDQKQEQIFSDSMITIEKENSTIVGIGFQSNVTMTKYTILHPTGFFPINNDE